MIVKREAEAELYHCTIGTQDYAKCFTTDSHENFISEMEEHPKCPGRDLLEPWAMREWSPKNLELRGHIDTHTVSLQEFEEFTIPVEAGFSNRLANPEIATFVSRPNSVGLSRYFTPQSSYSNHALKSSTPITAPWTYPPPNHHINQGYYTPPTSRSTSIVPSMEAVTDLPRPRNSDISISMNPTDAVSQADVFTQIQVLVAQEVLKTRLQSVYT